MTSKKSSAKTTPKETMESTFREVRLYFPNNWRRYIGNLVTDKDKRFNWFLCSQRYKDPSSGMYVAEISSKAQFYDEHTGETLSVPKDIAIKMLILDDPGNRDITSREIIPILTEYQYQGIAYLQRCDIANQDHFFVCREALFGFLNGVLRVSQRSSVCEIITYAKKNNECLRAFISDFPTSEEIDVALKTYECSLVSKILYEDIMGYMNRSEI
jgi:hypothetical protein